MSGLAAVVWAGWGSFGVADALSLKLCAMHRVFFLMSDVCLFFVWWGVYVLATRGFSRAPGFSVSLAFIFTWCVF